MMEPTDGELLMMFCSQRDEAAFEQIVVRHRSSVLGVCIRILGNRHDAEDAFQATFLVLARKAYSLQSASSVGGWLFRVAYRTAKNALGRRRRTTSFASTCEGGEDPLEHIQQREIVTTLYDELRRLPEKYQTPIVLCILEGKSRLEASAQLECSLPALKARLARGKRQLRIGLTRRGVAFTGAMTAAVTSVSQSANALDLLAAKTASNCAAVTFGNHGQADISPLALDLSEKGVTGMKIATLAKLGTVAFVSMLVASAAIMSTLEAGDVEQLGSYSGPTVTATVPNTDVRGEVKARIAQAVVKPEQTRQQPQLRPVPPAQPVSPAPLFADTPTADSFDFDPSDEQDQAVPDDAVRALIQSLTDDEAEVRYSAMRTLAAIGQGRNDVVEAFATAITKADDDQMRYFAAIGFGIVAGGKNQNTDAIEALSRAIQEDSNPEIRKVAIQSIAKVGGGIDLARQSVIGALKDRDSGVRIAATKALETLLRPQTSRMSASSSWGRKWRLSNPLRAASEAVDKLSIDNNVPARPVKPVISSDVSP